MKIPKLEGAFSIEVPFIENCIGSILYNQSLVIGHRRDDLDLLRSSYFASGFMSIPEHKCIGAVFEEGLWPFRENSFDLVMLDHVFIYIDDLYRVMEQAFFSICDGGTLVVVDFLNSKRGKLAMQKHYKRAHNFSLLYIREVLFYLGFVESYSHSFGFENNLFYNCAYQLCPSIAPLYIGVFKKKPTSVLPLPEKKQVIMPKRRGYVASIKSNLL